MKKAILILSSALILSACSFTKIGSLTVASTRNYESKTDYVLLKKYVSAKAKNKGTEGLQNAIDLAVKDVPGGEFMKNVKIYTKRKGKKIKVEGDVWGILPTTTTK